MRAEWADTYPCTPVYAHPPLSSTQARTYKRTHARMLARARAPPHTHTSTLHAHLTRLGHQPPPAAHTHTLSSFLASPTLRPTPTPTALFARAFSANSFVCVSVCVLVRVCVCVCARARTHAHKQTIPASRPRRVHVPGWAVEARPGPMHMPHAIFRAHTIGPLPPPHPFPLPPSPLNSLPGRSSAGKDVLAHPPSLAFQTPPFPPLTPRNFTYATNTLACTRRLNPTHPATHARAHLCIPTSQHGPHATNTRTHSPSLAIQTCPSNPPPAAVAP